MSNEELLNSRVNALLNVVNIYRHTECPVVSGKLQAVVIALSDDVLSRVLPQPVAVSHAGNIIPFPQGVR